jgi:hypothetical protein
MKRMAIAFVLLVSAISAHADIRRAEMTVFGMD